jgi:hypothetical protein
MTLSSNRSNLLEDDLPEKSGSITFVESRKDKLA